MKHLINNRELSWLVFNERVLQEAQDKSVPLMQRLRFLGIFSNNQDEFIKVRVANIIRMAESRMKNSFTFTGGYFAPELLERVNEKIEQSQRIFSRVYNEILSEMEAENIFVVNEQQLSCEQKEFCRNYFSDVISPRLVPLILRSKIDMPFLQDGDIYLGVRMMQRTSRSMFTRYAIIRIPTSSACPRFVVLPSKEGRHEIIFIDDIIRLCLDEIFFMFRYEEIAAYTFKFLRDALMIIDEDFSKSTAELMEEGIENRMHGRPVRMIYDQQMPNNMLQQIAKKLGLRSQDRIEQGGRYHLMKDLMKFPAVRSDLESRRKPSIDHPQVDTFSSILKVIKSRDLLLAYPYHSFKHVIDFLREAAIDPKVEAIYITLYRVADRSKVVNALINAAKNGKRVVALVELMARFDEEQNIENSDLLQNAGVKIIHGASGLKVHSKLIYVQRREGSSLTGYSYIGTGNFNESTAKIYGDFGLLTANGKISSEVEQVFSFLLNTHKRFDYEHLWVSPYNLRENFVACIDREIKNAKAGKKAYIMGKFNSLTDEKMVRKFYEASQAGVKVHLIVRGACCLAPEVEGLSENIRIISIVDSYLEHARLLIFCDGGKDHTYIMSADPMTRNLNRRVEVGTPIFDASIRKQLKEYFQIQWSDNVKARDLRKFGINKYVKRKEGDKEVRSQLALFKLFNKQ